MILNAGRVEQVGTPWSVYKQPETPDEEAQCREALEQCPVEAIGDDGA